ncbi:FG-GAP-like repeat-containing protein [Polyangium jinanense]|uniref:VCBS repeat-containing protein n=1 Tax=Polyangium jinanense TaxID=2829994 RepID=A0A9X3X6U1_9BACT|nr:FG-GAP-like repeat-containing protein [Polyangium jinanense]MDC3956674.1 VCBS repeat-containing protein [Polyangium jinanense]MDC3984737.1 VCBS repeat-containing protein [Polyangium jinanense]
MKRYHSMAIAIASVLAVSYSSTGCSGPAEPSAEENVQTDVAPLYVASSKLWSGESVQVCWENPSAAPQAERDWVRQAVLASWDAHTRVDFNGWGTCTSSSNGIRIRISDEGPHTDGLGTDLDGETDGMVLNFTFQNWSPDCQNSRRFCIEAIAVHEFGHALGFAHEQNRPDTPSWCDEEQGSDGDLTLNLWDLDSVMNYCNPEWNGNGTLSESDIQGAIQMYGTPRWITEYGYVQGWRVDKHPRMMADVDEDGKQDVVAFGDAGTLVSRSTGTGFMAPELWVDQYNYNHGWRTEYHERMMADVNNDGKPDVVGFGDAGVLVSLSTGSSFTAPSLWVGDYGWNQGYRVDKHPRMMADVNNDGKPDVVAFGDNGVVVSLSTGSSFTAPSLWLANYGYNHGYRIDQHPRMMADVNNDGKQDVVVFANNGVYVALSTGSSFSTPSLWVGNYGYNHGYRVDMHPRMTADVNGDGKQDIVAFGDNGVVVSTSTGSSFTTPQLWVNRFGYNQVGWRVEQHPRMMADVDNDGKDDVVGFGGNGVYISRSTGSSFELPSHLVEGFGYDFGWRVDMHPRMMADINGDGTQDVVGFANEGVFVRQTY